MDEFSFLSEILKAFGGLTVGSVMFILWFKEHNRSKELTNKMFEMLTGKHDDDTEEIKETVKETNLIVKAGK